MTSDLLIRTARPEDADQLAVLYVRGLRDAYAGTMPSDFVDPVTVAERASRLRVRIADGTRVWLLATSDTEIVGSCCLLAARDLDLPQGIGEIATIGVEPQYRRRGYGARLLRAARTEAARHGWRSLVIWVVTSNTEARALYAHEDFVADGATNVDERLGFPAEVIRYRVEV